MEAPCKSQIKTPIIEPQVEKMPVEFRPPLEINIARVPYPTRLKNQKYTREYVHFLDMFRQLKINLPFVKALQHMPKYAKFLKDLLKRKDRLGEVSSIPLSGDFSEVVLNRVPEKLSDPGVFTIPCTFGSNMMSQALADLGASINIMSYSLFEKLELVRVDNFVFPVNFVVLDMEADEKVPIILGRPFFRMAKALIDVFDKCLDYICGTDLVGMELDDELTENMKDDEEDVVDDVSCSAEIME
ncbi:uncharacterized protein LOC143580740, partial [Bidens hawaiensis]|uniref:uncharacterized protein LOC143580740 n=1 Tax=Bidens hawaiensis TaxID=980011 RepID=UPI00404B0B1F